MIIYNSHMPWSSWSSITKNRQQQYQTSPEFSTSFNVGKPMSETTHFGNGKHTTYLILFMVMFMALFYPPI